MKVAFPTSTQTVRLPKVMFLQKIAHTKMLLNLDTHDVYFAQGFVHAQDRLFQMEVNRLVSAGRVSELVGEPGINTDRFMRTIGLHLAGARVWDELDADMKEIVQAYSDGINAFIRMGQFPIEFTLAGHTPTRWHPQKYV
jgi:penicillin G amidase